MQYKLSDVVNELKVDCLQLKYVCLNIYSTVLTVNYTVTKLKIVNNCKMYTKYL